MPDMSQTFNCVIMNYIITNPLTEIVSESRVYSFLYGAYKIVTPFTSDPKHLYCYKQLSTIIKLKCFVNTL